jgi:hypothetical protein
MSIRALNWAFDLDHEDLNATLKLVLITRANYASDNDENLSSASQTKLGGGDASEMGQ